MDGVDLERHADLPADRSAVRRGVLSQVTIAFWRKICPLSPHGEVVFLCQEHR